MISVRGHTELGRARMLLKRQVCEVRRTIAENGRYLERKDIDDFQSIMDRADALLGKRVLFGSLRRDRDARVEQMSKARSGLVGYGMYLDMLVRHRKDDAASKVGKV